MLIIMDNWYPPMVNSVHKYLQPTVPVVVTQRFTGGHFQTILLIIFIMEPPHTVTDYPPVYHNMLV